MRWLWVAAQVALIGAWRAVLLAWGERFGIRSGAAALARFAPEQAGARYHAIYERSVTRAY